MTKREAGRQGGREGGREGGGGGRQAGREGGKEGGRKGGSSCHSCTMGEGLGFSVYTLNPKLRQCASVRVHACMCCHISVLLRDFCSPLSRLGFPLPCIRMRIVYCIGILAFCIGVLENVLRKRTRSVVYCIGILAFCIGVLDFGSLCVLSVYLQGHRAKPVTGLTGVRQKGGLPDPPPC
jgi:hypothetical protein